MSRLFKPSAKLTFIPQSSDTLARTRTADAIEIAATRIEFDVKKGVGKQPNKCVVKLNNLAPDTRARLEIKPARVLLHAGYDGELELLFDGDLKRAFSYLDDRVDTVTEVHLGDGSRAYSEARLTRSYKPPITLLQVLKDAAATMSLTLPAEVLKDPLFRQPLPSGFSSSGPTRDALSRLLSPYLFGWSSQNGQLTILRETQTREGQEFVVNQSTGLVGSPKFKESDHAGKGAKTEITFEHLLYPRLVPGCSVQLDSLFIKQRLKVTDHSSKGDTKPGGEFRTSIKGKPL